MRIWDVSPGYLNRQSLLGEHRELHGLASILVNGKDGYSRHPETVRWVGCLSGLARRHALLAAEMRFRGYHDHSPFNGNTSRLRWPEVFVSSPSQQFELLRTKYVGREQGRILLPRTSQQLWAQHKYSVMARDPGMYRDLGNRAARLRGRAGFDHLAGELVEILRRDADRGRLVTALEHLWGYVNKLANTESRRSAQASPQNMLRITQELALVSKERYLMASTALSDLAVLVDRA